jgi:EF hand
MKACWAFACLFLAVSLTIAGGDTGGGKKFKFDFEAFFKKLDSNSDGKLTKDEFLKMADRAKEKEQARAKLSQEYDKLDPEMKGIAKETFRRYLENGKNGNSPPAGKAK